MRLKEAGTVSAPMSSPGPPIMSSSEIGWLVKVKIEDGDGDARADMCGDMLPIAVGEASMGCREVDEYVEVESFNIGREGWVEGYSQVRTPSQREGR